MALFDLVFEGGGAKGSAFVGALRALEELGHGTRRLVGTSAGAITATLRAVGYTPTEMLEVLNERRDDKPRFASFMDPPHAETFTEAQRKASAVMHGLDAVHVPGFAKDALMKALLATPGFPELFCFIECGGIYAGDAFIDWLNEKLAAKGVAAGATLGSLARDRQVDLTLVASDTTDLEMLMLNHRTAPDVPVAWAVRMSMSIPFVWREVVWQADWGTYLGRAKVDHTIVDGGVLSNFPIQLVAKADAVIMGDTDPDGALSLGLLLDENLPVPGVEIEAKPSHHHTRQHRLSQRIHRLMDTMMRTRDHEVMRVHAAEICQLPAKGYGTTEFDMPAEKIHALVEAGYNTTMQHLKQRGLT